MELQQHGFTSYSDLDTNLLSVLHDKAIIPKFLLPWGIIDTPSQLNYKDLDIDHSLLLENFLDPSHIPFTHATTIGKRSMAAPSNYIRSANRNEYCLNPLPFSFPVKMSDLHFTTEDPDNGNRPKVSALQINPTRPDLVSTEFIFQPPCSVGLRFEFPEKPHLKMDQSFITVPTKKGHCRFVYMQR